MAPKERRPAVEVGAEVWVAAEADRIWSVLTDVEAWSRWHRGIGFARLRGTVEPGAAFHLRLDGMHVVSAIQEVDPERTLEWRGRCFGATLHQRWLLDPATGGTWVRARESVDGWLVRLVRGTVRRTVQRSLDEWVEGLKLRSESGGDGPDRPRSDDPSTRGE